GPRIQRVQSNAQTGHPQGAGRVLEEASDDGAAQARRIARVVPEVNSLVPVVARDPEVGAEPHEAASVLQHGPRLLVREIGVEANVYEGRGARRRRRVRMYAQ